MSTSCQRYESVVYELKTSAVVWGASGYGNPAAGPVAVSALWDTGARCSVVTQKIVDALGLVPIARVSACGVNGWYDTPVYVVDIMLPNRMKIQGVRVSLGAMEVADMLIGMDVISMGDFKLTNDGKTSFSIRTPSEGDAPFVADVTEESAR